MWICVKTRLHFLVSLSATKKERDVNRQQKQTAFEAEWPQVWRLCVSACVLSSADQLFRYLLVLQCMQRGSDLGIMSCCSVLSRSYVHVHPTWCSVLPLSPFDRAPSETIHPDSTPHTDKPYCCNTDKEGSTSGRPHPFSLRQRAATRHGA